MNRSILIVIADFLLVSLLAFSSFDAERLTGDRPTEQFRPSLDAAKLNGDEDLAGAFKVALADERRAQEQLTSDLAKSQEELRRQQDLATARAQQGQTLQQSLQAQQEQTRQLLENQRALQQQIALAQTNIQNLQQQVKASSTDATSVRQRLSAAEAELRQQQQQYAQAQQQLAQLEQNRLTLQREKQQLSEKLQVTEAEKRAAAQQVAALQTEVATVRTEKAQLVQHADKLAEGVTALAQNSDKLADRVTALAKNSGDLTKEVREFRPIAANTIFNEFVANRVHAQFFAARSGLFGITVTKRRETDTVLVTDGTNTFALCHIGDTPMALSDPGMDWETLTGNLERAAVQLPIEKLSLYLLDPRVVIIPVNSDQAKRLGCTIYHLAHDPFKFQGAVLVGAREGYYGECDFRIDLTTPQYVRMDRSIFRGLFGKFNPSRGDLVFSKAGELLGVMANSTYCVVMHNFKPATTFQFGQEVGYQNTGEVLARFFRLVNELPFKLR